MRHADRAASARFAQGRLRTRRSSSPARAARPAPPHLAARAALRSGGGLVTVATPARSCRSSPALGAEYMTVPLAERRTARSSADAARRGAGVRRRRHRRRARAWARPGRRPRVRARPGGALPACRWCSTPTPSTPSPDDATGLVGPRRRAVVITPHPGEMARLVGRARSTTCRPTGSTSLANSRATHRVTSC